MTEDEKKENASELIKGKDYYINDKGLWVFTEDYLRRRGYCCGSGCKHCPYNKVNNEK